MIDLSIIIPAYNEAARIAPTLQRINKYLSAQSRSYEIIVVDDGSADGTFSLVATMSREIYHLSVIRIYPNAGKGAAVKKGMLSARGRIRVFSDADGSTPIEELDKLLRVLESGDADIAIGSRYLRGSEVVRAQPWFRVIWSRLVNRLMQLILLPGILDPHCGFKAFTEQAVEDIFPRCKVPGWSFDIEVLAFAQALGFRVREVPVRWENDDRSKARISHLPAELMNVIRIRRSLRNVKR